MTLKISPHAIEQNQGPFIFPGILVGSGPDLPAVPDGTLHVWSGSAGAVTAHANADDLVVENNDMGGISILVPDVTWANIYFGQGAVNNSGFIRYGGVTHQLEFGVNQATIAYWLPGQVTFIGNPFTIYASGVLALESPTEVIVNNLGDDVDFRVKSDTQTHALFVQGSSGSVGINGIPTNKLTIFGGNIEIRDGWDLMIRPAGNGWDWRIRQTGTQLDFHSGGDLVNPKVSFLNSGYVGIDNNVPTALLHLGDLAEGTPATFTGDIKLAGPTRTTLAAVGGIEFLVAGDGYGAKIQALSDAGTVLAFGLRGASAIWVEAMRIRPDLGLGLQTTLSIKERAAALGDIPAYGQLWVKNTTPCELWFTDDAGTDTQIV